MEFHAESIDYLGGSRARLALAGLAAGAGLLLGVAARSIPLFFPLLRLLNPRIHLGGNWSLGVLGLRMVLRILSLADVILLRASHAAAIPASTSQIRPSLREGYNADAGLLGLVRMLANLAALASVRGYVFVSDQFLILSLALLHHLRTQRIRVGRGGVIIVLIPLLGIRRRGGSTLLVLLVNSLLFFRQLTHL